MLCSWCRAQTDQRRARRVAAFPAPCLPRRRAPSQYAERRAKDSPCAAWPHAQNRFGGAIRISLEENAHRSRQFELMKINIIHSTETVQPTRRSKFKKSSQAFDNCGTTRVPGRTRKD